MLFRRSIIVILSGIFFLVTIFNVVCIQKMTINSVANIKSGFPLSNRTFGKINAFTINHTLNNNSEFFLKQRSISKRIKALPARYFKQNTKYKFILQNILKELTVNQNQNTNIVDIINNWPSSHQLIPSQTHELGSVIEFLRTVKISNVDNAKLGTQLKLMITFENGLKAIFKPQWYDRTTKIKGLVYHGKDRHNAEVVAFYLALLLSFRRVPLALIRKLKFDEEIKKNATPELLATFLNKYNSTCFYGVCHYCTLHEPICARSNILEGSIILWLPSNCKLIKYKHPWQRTYSKSQLAFWENNMNYCSKVQQTKMYSMKYSSRLLDLIDVAIFDFLMDNGDRHHYEILQYNEQNSAILLIDNGKSLGNPDVDHVDILAPLYQCCVIRKATWKRLQLLSGGSLSYALKELLAHESYMANVLPLITNQHLNAIDRRLLTIFAVVEFCIHKNQYPNKVILN